MPTKIDPALQHRLGYEFRSEDLLRLALTHSSLRSASGKAVAKNDDNERLEFLGDRVLALVIAERLEGRFPDAREGELARRFNRLVRKETCAEIAETLELGKHILMSESEAKNGGREKPTILADACEAILGAVFLDGGYEPARNLVLLFWDPLIGKEDAAPIDPKSALQEWVLGQKKDLPHYVEVSREGPAHMPHFISEVRVEGLDPAQGEGGSKRIAEQNAARRMLVDEGVWDMNDNV